MKSPRQKIKILRSDKAPFRLSLFVCSLFWVGGMDRIRRISQVEEGSQADFFWPLNGRQI
jgi:hypothetical protein